MKPDTGTAEIGHRQTAAPAVHRETAKPVGACNDAPRRPARHDRERPRRDRVLGAVDDQRSRSGQHDERHVAALVDMPGLTFAGTPDEESGVQVAACDAPRRTVPVQCREVDDLHAGTVVVRGAAYPLHVKVLGIDPGTAACGYGIVHESDGRIRAIDHGCWTSGARERPELRLRKIFDGVTVLISEHAPDAVALEESFVGADARIALFVGQARGAALVAAASAGLACTEYAPARVKQTVCGYGRADKQQVARMVRMILSLDSDIETSHASDALAVAICHVSMPPLARLAS